MRTLSIILASLVLSACTTQYGNPITDSQLAQIKKGETTKAQLLSSFGQPLATARNSDGTQVMSWGHAKVGFAGSFTFLAAGLPAGVAFFAGVGAAFVSAAAASFTGMAVLETLVAGTADPSSSLTVQEADLP